MLARRGSGSSVEPLASWRFGRLRLAVVSPCEAGAWIVARARSRTGAIVVTSNVHHLRLAELDPRFRAVVESAEFNVADGWPLILASRLLGHPLPGRVAGIDLVADVLMESGLRV